MTKLALPLSLLALGFGSVTALDLSAQSPAPAIPGNMDLSRITGGTYTADSAHSLVGWRVDHLGFNDYFGLFGDIEGTLSIDPAEPTEAMVDVTIPVGGVVVASSGLRDHLLRPGKDGENPDFFGAAPAPARYVSRTVAIGEDGTSAAVAGDLTLNGITRPVELAVRFTGAGTGPRNKRETIGFEGTATIRRSEFGIGYGIPMVSDEVELELTAAFEK